MVCIIQPTRIISDSNWWRKRSSFENIPSFCANPVVLLKTEYLARHWQVSKTFWNLSERHFRLWQHLHHLNQDAQIWFWPIVPWNWNFSRECRREFAKGAGYPYSLAYHRLTAVTDFSSIKIFIHFTFGCVDWLTWKICCSYRHCDNVCSTLLLCKYLSHRMIWGL